MSDFRQENDFPKRDFFYERLNRIVVADLVYRALKGDPWAGEMLHRLEGVSFSRVFRLIGKSRAVTKWVWRPANPDKSPWSNPAPLNVSARRLRQRGIDQGMLPRVADQRPESRSRPKPRVC